MNVNRSFQFVFEDPKWFKKLAIGALIALVPILGFAFTGYTIEVLRNIAARNPNPLPEWDHISQNFMDGLMYILALLLYVLAVIILLIPPFILIWPLVILVMPFWLPGVMIHYARVGTFQSCFEFKQIFRLIVDNAGDYFLAWIIIWGVGLGVGTVISVLSTVLSIIPILGWLAAVFGGALIGAWQSLFSSHLYGLILDKAASR